MNVSGHTPDSSQTTVFTPPASGVVFPDRRASRSDAQPAIERRQFANSHSELSEEARQLGQAIDQYKLIHRRRYITYEEMLNVIKSLGYHRDQG